MTSWLSPKHNIDNDLYYFRQTTALMVFFGRFLELNIMRVAYVQCENFYISPGLFFIIPGFEIYNALLAFGYQPPPIGGFQNPI